MGFSATIPQRFGRWFSAPPWLRGFTMPGLRSDVVAGITLAAYLLPAAIGDASLARVPPEAGLYACVFSGLIFWALCSSRYTVVTVTSAISLVMGTTLGDLAGGDPSRFGALAACTALMVGVLAFTAWATRAGSLVRFISESVMTGFKAGVALTLIGTQLPKFCGIGGVHGTFLECARSFVMRLGEINPASLIVGAAALAVLVLGKVFLKNRPVAIFVVVGGIIAARLLGLDAHGVKLLGEVPRGLPTPGIPAVHWSDVDQLLPLAMACFLLAAFETSAIGRMFASKRGERFDANREFLALAGANLAAGLGRGVPVSGGMSQSLVNESAGARTPLSGLLAALVVLAVALFLSGMLRYLPQPVLAAIVLMAVPGLVNVSALRRLWRVDKSELLVALVALAGVLGFGLLRGVLIGAVISMVLLIRRASRPHVAFLGRIPGVRRYSDLERHPDNQPVPGILIFRSESSILYFNADHVRDTVVARVRASNPRPGDVLCDLSATPLMDMAGAEMLKVLESELRSLDVCLHIVEARSSVRDRLRLEGLEERIGRIDRFTSVADAVDAIQLSTSAAEESAPGSKPSMASGSLASHSNGTADHAPRRTTGGPVGHVPLS
jgi:high affinity sulfate transporter 1